MPSLDSVYARVAARGGAITRGEALTVFYTIVDKHPQFFDGYPGACATDDDKVRAVLDGLQALGIFDRPVLAGARARRVSPRSFRSGRRIPSRPKKQTP